MIRAILFTALLIGVAFSSISRLAVAEESARPNILVLLADDVSWKDFGCYGNKAVRTPNINHMACGLRFTNAFLTTSSCSPTRISVLTGKYPHATGAEDLHMPLPAGQRLVSSYLQSAGYFTGHMLKTHYGPNGMKQFQWYSKNVAEFPKFLDEAGERPFFMWVGFRDAHRPYKPGAVDPPHDPAKVQVPPYLADTPETRADLALYYDEIARMDGHIGQMTAELKRRKMSDNTLVVFFSDNGMPFPRAKGTLYDSGIGTPLLMTWPRVIPHCSVHKGLESVIDLAPTFLEVAGIEKPADMQGSSLFDVIKGPSQPGVEYVFSERNWHNCDHHMRSVRSQRFKLIWNPYTEVPFGHPSDCSRCPSWNALQSLKKSGGLAPQQALIFKSPRPKFELYDLEADPWEFHNLAADAKYSGQLAELKIALEDWRKRTGDVSPERRRRADNSNRVTGIKFTQKIPPLVE